MNAEPKSDLVSSLARIKEDLAIFAHSESRHFNLIALDEMIEALRRLRAELADPTLVQRAAEIQNPVEQVIGFLEAARDDEALRWLFSPSGKPTITQSKKQAVEIESNLTNEQIRSLLRRELSKAELKAIAAQRAISTGKGNSEEIRRNILRNLERQEGYGRLATP